MENNNPIVAVRSLMCADHAHNIPPTVRVINWFLGKRCNYDCSYCSPHIHDAVSPFIDLVSAKKFVDKAYSQCQWPQKIKWGFTGGEPFVDPGFLPLIDHISQGACEQIDVTTNGSLPYSTYLKSSKFLNGLTFSLHLERSQKEIDTILETILRLKDSTDLFLSINLMFLAGKGTQVTDIQKKLRDNDVPVAVRKITPPVLDQKHLPFVQTGNGKKQQQLHDTEVQTEHKNIWRIENDLARGQNIIEYYTPGEIAQIQTANTKPLWQNMAFWDKSGCYREVNTEYLVAHDANSFQSWICYAGVDGLYIDFDGRIYVGQCLNGRSIGHINDDTPPFQQNPVICQRQWCTCNNDIPVRKCVSDSYLDLIT